MMLTVGDSLHSVARRETLLPAGRMNPPKLPLTLPVFRGLIPACS